MSLRELRAAAVSRTVTNRGGSVAFMPCAGCNDSVCQSGERLLLISAPGDGIGPATVLQVGRPTSPATHQAQYLFGCPEGFSRLVLEHKVRPSAGLRAVLVSACDARANGGLVSLLLRLRDDGHEQVRVVGPRNTSGQLHAARHLLRWHHPAVYVDEARPPAEGVPWPSIEDRHVHIRPIPIETARGSRADGAPWSCPLCLDRAASSPTASDTSDGSPEFTTSSGSSGGDDVPSPPPKRPRPRTPSPEYEAPFAAAAAPGNPLLMRPPSGPGPLLCGPAAPLLGYAVAMRGCGALVIVMDCPRLPAAVASLADHPALSCIRASISTRHPNATVTIVHHTAPEVAVSSAYRVWLAGLTPTARHILPMGLCPDAPPSTAFGHLAALRVLGRMHVLGGPRLFPIPTVAPSSHLPLSLSPGSSTVGADLLLQIAVNPMGQAAVWTCRVLVPPLSDAPAAPKTGSAPWLPKDWPPAVIPEVAGLAVAAAVDTGVVFLGTGCAEPSQHRGGSSIVLEPRGPCGPLVVLDAGEGALGALAKYTAAVGAPGQAIGRVALVWLSHRHADHALGLLSLLEARAAAVAALGPATPPLVVIVPRAVARWIAEALPPESARASRVYHFFDFDRPGPPAVALASALAPLGLVLRSVPVRHCADACGCVLRHQSGWSLAYTGDTVAPAERLLAAAQGVTLLVHEATFAPTALLTARAAAIRHSTTTQACAAGAACGAYRTALTHFSSRTPAAVTLLPGPGRDTAACVVDGMRVPLALLESLPALQAAAEAAYGADESAEPEDAPASCCFEEAE